jgi:hypothetical protein
MKLHLAGASLCFVALGAAFLAGAVRAEDVTLYSNRYFSGEKKSLSGDWNGKSSWGNRTRSIRVPDGYRVTVYSETDYRGSNKVITSDWSLRPTDRWNGRIRSVRVERSQSDDGWADTYPTLYSSSQFGGQRMTLKSTWDGRRGMSAAHSVRVPRGWSVTVYSEDMYRGRSFRLSGDWSASHSGAWRYPVRSARAERDGGFGGSGGSWDGWTTVYSRRDFGGVSRTLTGDWSGDSTWDGSPYGIHSIRVAPGAKLTCYDQPGYRGTQTVITDDWNPPAGAWWAGRIRSIRISYGNVSGGSPDSGYAALYSQPNFYGATKTITGDWKGDSSWDGSPYAVHSIKVRRGSVLTCYSEPNYRGRTMVLSSDWTASPGNWWAGRIRSIRMSATGNAPTPRSGSTGVPWIPGRR